MSEEDRQRSAIVDRREQAKAEPRPERLSDIDISEAVAEVRETDDLFKVYRPEWMWVYTSEANGDAGLAEAKTYFAEKYQGRVHEIDVEYLPTSENNPSKWPWRISLRLPNVKGEFKLREHAETYIAEKGWGDAAIVSRNSRDEYKLKAYGDKKLRVE